MWNKGKGRSSSFKPKATFEGKTKVVMKEKRRNYQGREYVEFSGVFSEGAYTYILTAYEKPGGGFLHTELKGGQKADMPFLVVHVAKVSSNNGGGR